MTPAYCTPPCTPAVRTASSTAATVPSVHAPVLWRRVRRTLLRATPPWLRLLVERGSESYCRNVSVTGHGEDRSDRDAARSCPNAMDADELLPAFDIGDDERFTHRQHMLAGAVAGMIEHSFMFPVDTIKTRMQVYGAAAPAPDASTGRLNSRAMWPMVRAIVGTEGVRTLWRGIGAVLISAGPAHAAHFSIYEAVKLNLTPLMSGYGAPDAMAHAMAGATATISSESIMAPMDVIKQRMQLGASGPKAAREGVIPTIVHVYRNFGFSAFFAGLKATLAMSIPFSATQFVVYEAVKSSIVSRNRPHLAAEIREKGKGRAAATSASEFHPGQQQPADRIENMPFNAVHHCLAGAAAGAIASAVTNPLDVVKTRLQTQGEIGARRYRGMMHAIRHIWIEERVPGFLRGIKPRIMFHAPAAAICWTTYELSKHIIGLQ
ncbi:putative mitochondrial carrier [Porphyridium purpureum]|uniref:Putative mitochondrial carrier n=1 Tax=Porphyridium purpureum TaxID=35688 RepID=A0A5J4Z103_PORPP|nr:putative mitochondrial carrier [Porphyridium purpureum]|eukprot:POR9559..scf208_2